MTEQELSKVVRNTWLVFDADNALARSWHALKSMDDRAVGMVYGFFRELKSLQARFNTDRCVFCFDSRDSLRRQLYAGYKQKRALTRALMTRQDIAEDTERHFKIEQVRKEYLPALGYKNILHAKGYEADDHVAAVVADQDRCLDTEYGRLTVGEPQQQFIIVSTDKDLYQLLAPNVSIWRTRTSPTVPPTMTTVQSFQEEYGIPPKRWVKVKCIAGCSSDDVPGVVGVGEVKAIQYLRGQMSKTTKTYGKILAAADLILSNRALVKLPFEGCPPCTLVEDDYSPRKWAALMEQLEMPSLV